MGLCRGTAYRNIGCSLLYKNIMIMGGILMSETKEVSKKFDTVFIGSMELLQILARENKMVFLKTVKFKEGYPLFGLTGVPKVMKIVHDFTEEHCGGTGHAVDDFALWKDHVDFLTTEKKPSKMIITRNFKILKDIVLSGYACRLNKVFVDKNGKRVYRFYSCPEIEKIKAEGDKASHERWAKKQGTKAEEKPVNEEMKNLIDKAMADANSK